MRTIRLPNGQSVSMTAYVDRWRYLKDTYRRQMTGEVGYVEYSGFFDHPAPPNVILATIQQAVHERITDRMWHAGGCVGIALPGRRWTDEYQIQLARDAKMMRDHAAWNRRLERFETDIFRRKFGHLLEQGEVL